MAVSNLRRANTGDNSLERYLTGLSTARLSLKSVASEEIEPLCDDYPFSQRVYQGTIIYNEPSQYTPGREIEIDFEYRDGSQLFILDLETDVSSVDRLAQNVADAIPEGFTVYRNLHVPEDGLWSFLEQADSVIDIHVLDQGHEVPYDEVEGVSREDVVGEYAIEKAEVGFVVDGHQIVVRYYQGSIQIETDWPNGREYILQLFEREAFSDNS
ncbi:hypothetical protein BDK88_4230 [Natrinema hispanicum]|uniref:Uncharacterized protein n=1 Tax=Natrinema hispanicum TaxID=392421 RepID=A0A482Y6X7_9EURY|nr:hypothetical protein [Natrinema hispanicum]RZV05207.1 hypothetical protein BDK88_4230 [Natrinema hispanicum]